MKFLNILAALSLVLFIGCGGGGSNEQQQQQSEDSMESQETEMAGEASNSNVRTIHIIGVDQMKYAVKEDAEGITVGDPVGKNNLPELQSITVEPGEKIRIVLETQSTLPASAMAHNWILLTMDSDPQAFANTAQKARDSEYLPSDLMNEVITHVPLTAGGETNEITFTAPEETGDYEYLCSFPGHFSAGMRGTLNVEEAGGESGSDSSM